MLILVVLLYHISAVPAVVYQTPQSAKIRAGHEVNLTCYIEDFRGFCFTVVWLKINFENTLDVYHSIKFPGQHIQNGKPVDTKCNLTIRNAQLTDSGTYVCMYLKNSVFFMGNGTALTVIEQPDVPTSLVILIPSEDGDSYNNATTVLTCLVFGVNFAKIFWNISGIIQEGRSDFGRLVNDPSAKHYLRNQFIIPLRNWTSGDTFTCIVKTESGEYLTKSVKKSEPVNCILYLGAQIVGCLLLTTLLIINLICCWVKTHSGKANRYVSDDSKNERQAHLRCKKRTGQKSANRFSRGTQEVMEREEVQYASLELRPQVKRWYRNQE
ncbi:uncharacterized protein LOC120527743 isoform X1 [Polypterus senegalus]|uniref:uncharacterized protein LOC120527743 isoform X1 n=1 Tax=Polypterus senegalus TaxID=55291 RepID=UPI001965B24F|nr:uncharacterized protein LOC120527743 isoform X1 [Polypterus senegalus]